RAWFGGRACGRAFAAAVGMARRTRARGVPADRPLAEGAWQRRRGSGDGGEEAGARGAGMLTTSSAPIAVPASVANLGAGFDALAVAVQVYLRVMIVDVKSDGRGEVTVRRSTPPVPAENGVERAYRSLASRAPAGLPSVTIDIESEIPIGSGLGSSAAATIAGLRLFERVTAPLTPQELLDAACALEGHPDNAAAALYGGFAVSLQYEDGRTSVVTLEWPTHVRFVIATPDRALRTEAARKVLPAAIPMRDAVFN